MKSLEGIAAANAGIRCDGARARNVVLSSLGSDHFALPQFALLKNSPSEIPLDIACRATGTRLAISADATV